MCGISGIVVIESSDVLELIKYMNENVRHRGPDDEGYVFFQATKPFFNCFGSDDTPDDVFSSSEYPYLPVKKFSGNVPKGSNLALGHRRLSIIDLSPKGHQPMSTTDGRYWIVYNGEIITTWSSVKS